MTTPVLLTLLIKINLALLLFAAGYYLVLRRLTFYKLNRAYLIFGILFSSAYPFINLTDFFYRQKSIPTAVVEWVPAINQKVQLGPWGLSNVSMTMLLIIFSAGVLLMLIRLTRQFIELYRVHRRSQKDTIHNALIRIVEDELSPFTFWKSIYINPRLHSDNELKHILAHENVHVKQLHTIDIILAELSVAFYWFNPGVWLMKKAVKENIEFITDETVLKGGIDRKSYQYSLLDVSSLPASTPITSNFNLEGLKKRIRMMNAKRSSRLLLSRYILLLPALVFFSLAFTIVKREAGSNKQNAVLDHTTNSAVIDLPTSAPALQPPQAGNQVTSSIKPNRSLRQTPTRDQHIAIPEQPLPDETTVIPQNPGVIRSKSVPPTDTAGINQLNNSSSQEKVITVVGYPTPKKAQMPGQNQKDNIPPAEPAIKSIEPETIVVGYRKPRTEKDDKKMQPSITDSLRH